MWKSWHIFAGPIKYFYNIARLKGCNFSILQLPIAIGINFTTNKKNGTTD
jgi:hypothetical protein